LKRGAHIVNDVSGLTKEPRFADLCAKYNAGYILMHSQGDPKTMQKNPSYVDLIGEIGSFFEEVIQKLKKKGVQTVIIDPGIGFGKLLSHNLELIANLSHFKKLKVPIMVGASRKAMIGQILDGRPASDRLTGTIAVHYHCLMNGADILRVHDVKEAMDSVKVYNSLRGFSNHLE
ncbi:MAG: dihydropteroate synthase, partial [Balneolaceae bacterium]